MCSGITGVSVIWLPFATSGYGISGMRGDAGGVPPEAEIRSGLPQAVLCAVLHRSMAFIRPAREQGVAGAVSPGFPFLDVDSVYFGA
jgi:hypothetical protein